MTGSTVASFLPLPDSFNNREQCSITEYRSGDTGTKAARWGGLKSEDSLAQN